MPIRALIRAYGRSEQGAVAIVVAILLTVLIGFLALGVDLGMMYFRQKDLQTRADLAAVSAVLHVDGDAAGAAERTAGQDGGPDLAVSQVALGRFTRDAALPPEARMDYTAPATLANAATVRLEDRIPLHFASAFLHTRDVPISAEATAARADLAAFTLGSRLASIDTGDSAVLNAVLGSVLDSSLSLSVLDYDGLADAKINLLEFSDALATRLDLQALTYEEILDTDADLPDLVGALLDIGPTPAVTAALTKVLNAGSSESLNISRLIDIEGDEVGLRIEDILDSVQVSVLDILMASVEVVNANSLIDLPLSIPGLADAHLVVGERVQGSGWITIGARGATLHTAQIRLRLDIDLDAVLARVRLPVYLEIAGATATLTGVDACGRSDDNGVVAVFDTGSDAGMGGHGSQIVKVFVGELVGKDFRDTTSYLTQADFDPVFLLKVSLLGIPIANVEIEAFTFLGAAGNQQMTFLRSEIGQTKLYDAKINLSGTVAALLAPQSSQTGEGAHIDVSLLGLKLGKVTDILHGTVYPVLAALTGLLDPLLNTVLDLLGIKLGEAELTLTGTACGGIMLVR
ncbi:pilus assembly protein TadG-related protein [Celeribacter indicus]|uniref:Putative Flp pilus-assembly TadG-like N-terminal domain-containing protein n=1 Tax=Celeribacter indicus TaxID=1208324 RepID=A0A0B5E941_9RHOB|nr:pilus assembly protein TadG-related protein [Celeribacter indicus]AJE48842.1 hypothetical protein P73_4127 [Celeribacter indicus]SDW38868.1 Uncharacterized membrane protein [Celeribacter indicus]